MALAESVTKFKASFAKRQSGSESYGKLGVMPLSLTTSSTEPVILDMAGLKIQRLEPLHTCETVLLVACRKTMKIVNLDLCFRIPHVSSLIQRNVTWKIPGKISR